MPSRTTRSASRSCSGSTSKLTKDTRRTRHKSAEQEPNDWHRRARCYQWTRHLRRSLQKAWGFLISEAVELRIGPLLQDVSVFAVYLPISPFARKASAVASGRISASHCSNCTWPRHGHKLRNRRRQTVEGCYYYYYLVGGLSRSPQALEPSRLKDATGGPNAWSTCTALFRALGVLPVLHIQLPCRATGSRAVSRTSSSLLRIMSWPDAATQTLRTRGSSSTDRVCREGGFCKPARRDMGEPGAGSGRRREATIH